MALPCLNLDVATRQPVTLQKQEESKNMREKLVGYVVSICGRILGTTDNMLMDCTGGISWARGGLMGWLCSCPGNLLQILYCDDRE